MKETEKLNKKLLKLDRYSNGFNLSIFVSAQTSQNDDQDFNNNQVKQYESLPIRPACLTTFLSLTFYLYLSVYLSVCCQRSLYSRATIHLELDK